MGKEQTSVQQQELLSGWKDIARYLGKSVRTVQRYERELSLPVRRLSGKHRASVLAMKGDLDSWLELSAAPREPFTKTTLTIQKHLISEIAKGLRERAELQAQMAALRRELETGMHTFRESMLKLRQQLSETRRHQVSIASAIKRYSNHRALVPVNGKHRKPN
jgi:hypothetical protein